MKLERKLRILVVDDSPTELKLMEALVKRLAPQGSQVDVAENGEKAIAFLRLRPYDAVVSDIHLGDRSGVEVCAEAQKRHPRSRRILVTSDEDVRTLQQALEKVHVEVYLMKRWGPERTAPQLERVLWELAQTDG